MKLTLLPIVLTKEGNKSQIGLPRKSNDPAIVQSLQEMCRPYGVELTEQVDGTLLCAWKTIK